MLLLLLVLMWQGAALTAAGLSHPPVGAVCLSQGADTTLRRVSASVALMLLTVNVSNIMAVPVLPTCLVLSVSPVLPLASLLSPSPRWHPMHRPHMLTVDAMVSRVLCCCGW